MKFVVKETVEGFFLVDAEEKFVEVVSLSFFGFLVIIPLFVVLIFNVSNAMSKH